MNKELETPYYIVYENKLRKNLELIQKVGEEAGVEIIMAFKANALWKTFPIIKEYTSGVAVSSPNEMMLAKEFFEGHIHIYSPVYKERDFENIVDTCDRITFNSINQFEKFKTKVNLFNSRNHKKISMGLRINPEFSQVQHEIYNPCIPGSRFGVIAADLEDTLPEDLEGFHFHALCESDSYELENLLKVIRIKFGKWLPKLKWINMGGGHLMTREDYDTYHLIKILKDFNRDYPNLKIILEPGSAFTWQTGDLVTEVLDLTENQGIKTAIIDASFACHMPDCLEMPYKPIIKEALADNKESGNLYRLGGNTCLTGDFVGDWKFKKPLKIGDRLTLLDMNHYTTVKTNMFNGVSHPSIWLEKKNGEKELLREFTYDDYKSRMD